MVISASFCVGSILTASPTSSRLTSTCRTIPVPGGHLFQWFHEAGPGADSHRCELGHLPKGAWKCGTRTKGSACVLGGRDTDAPVGHPSHGALYNPTVRWNSHSVWPIGSHYSQEESASVLYLLPAPKTACSPENEETSAEPLAHSPCPRLAKQPPISLYTLVPRVACTHLPSKALIP